MEWLNYHHLFYFWTVAKEGSIARACAKLRLAQPTISGQLRMLEDTMGEKLFTKSGRGLVMTRDDAAGGEFEAGLHAERIERDSGVGLLHAILFSIGSATRRGGMWRVSSGNLVQPGVSAPLRFDVSFSTARSAKAGRGGSRRAAR